LLQIGSIFVGVFPHGEEALVGSLGFWRCRAPAGQVQIGERIEVSAVPALVVNDLLKSVAASAPLPAFRAARLRR
jgi:hypothetical protein